MKFIDRFIRSHPIKRIRISSFDAEYIAGGKSRTGFIIFPGGGQDIYSSYDLINAYEKKYKVISLSISGFFNLKTFFDYVDKILVVERINKIIVYGLSLGGFIAQHYVRLNPERVIKFILSHTSSTRSRSLIRKVIIPGKIAFFFLPVVPIRLLKYLVKINSGRIQAGQNDVLTLWKKYSTKINLERRTKFIERFGLNFLNRTYMNSFYRLGIEMEKAEKQWKTDYMKTWSKNILLIKTDNDSLAQDDGILKQYYPHAQEYVFHGTGHLSPFIQFEKLKRVIDGFLALI